MAMALPAGFPSGVLTGTMLLGVSDSEPIPARGYVTITPAVPTATFGDTMLLLREERVALDSTGHFEATLVATEGVNPHGWTYRIEFNVVGAKTSAINIAVPSGSVQDLTDLYPIVSSDGETILRGPAVDLEIGSVNYGPEPTVTVTDAPDGKQYLHFVLPPVDPSVEVVPDLTLLFENRVV